MFNKKQLFRRVAIVGTGFMGASLGLAIKKKELAREIVGIGRHETSLREATDIGAITEGTLDIKKGVIGADLIILATPVNSILEILEFLGNDHKRPCIITDLGSTKAEIVERAEKVLHHTVLFVGSHPIVGSEKKGPTYANGQLFDGVPCIMTPTDKTNRLAKEKIKQFWTQLGCVVKTMSPVEHDQVLAYTSHLPHIMAFAMMKAIPESYLEHSAGGLKDSTRIAASDPEMWRDISLSNHKQILKGIDETVKALATIRKAIVTHDREGLTEAFKQGKVKREALDKHHGS